MKIALLGAECEENLALRYQPEKRSHALLQDAVVLVVSLVALTANAFGAGYIAEVAPLAPPLPASQTNPPVKEPAPAFQTNQTNQLPPIESIVAQVGVNIDTLYGLGQDIPKPETDIEVDIKIDAEGKATLTDARKVTANSTNQLQLSTLPSTQKELKVCKFSSPEFLNRTLTLRFTAAQISNERWRLENLSREMRDRWYESFPPKKTELRAVPPKDK